MFGTNESANPRESGYLVHSIFPTIQGEGPFVGTPSLFVRFAGCNLKCAFCDTNFEGGDEYVDVEDLAELLVKNLIEFDVSLVVFTGGEPLLQPLAPLIESVTERMGYGVRFQIETSGSYLHSDVVAAFFFDTSIVISPKTPRFATGLEAVLATGALTIPDRVFFKYIVGKDTTIDDFDRHPDWLPKRQIFLQPMDVDNEGPLSTRGEEETRENTEKVVDFAMRLGYRVSLQTHKILGVP